MKTNLSFRFDVNQ